MATDAPRVTPLEEAQRGRGAEFVSGLGWRWVKTFGDPKREYEAVRNAVGMWDASPHTKWGFRGPDALEALDLIFTRDLTGMEIGQVCYGPFCDDRGMMIGDATVFRHAEDRFWVVTAPSTDSDLDHFIAVVADLDVAIDARTDDLPQLGVNGPDARALLQGLSSCDLAHLRYFRFSPERLAIAGVACWVSRTGYSGELGYELFADPGDMARLWDAIVGAGAVPYGLDAVEMIRVESGLIAYGADFVPHETSPFDVNLDRFVDVGKKRFCGSKALESMAVDPPNSLVTLILGDAMPQPGAAVVKAGAEVGRVTSPVQSPLLGQSIALALLRRDLARVNETVEVRTEDRDVPAVIGETPIYDSQKARPRS